MPQQSSPVRCVQGLQHLRQHEWILHGSVVLGVVGQPAANVYASRMVGGQLPARRLRGLSSPDAGRLKSRPTWQKRMPAQTRSATASVANLGIQVRYASLDAIGRPTFPFCSSSAISGFNSPLSCHLIATTIESGPTRCSTLVSRKPASRIHFEQSSPV